MVRSYTGWPKLKQFKSGLYKTPVDETKQGTPNNITENPVQCLKLAIVNDRYLSIKENFGKILTYNFNQIIQCAYYKPSSVFLPSLVASNSRMKSDIPLHAPRHKLA